jgi:hypothetical protein
MQNGLKKIDPYFNPHSSNLKIVSKNITLGSFVEVNLFLNLFLVNENYELDVVECSSFCENTGKWI